MLGAASQAREVPLPVAITASPEELGPGAEAQPMAGTSAAVATAVAIGHRAETPAGAERYVASAQVAMSLGLGGVLQLDAAFGTHLGADLVGGGARIDTSLGGLRLGGRLALSRRDPGESGWGGALTVHVETPWGRSAGGAAATWRYGIAADARFGRLHVAGHAVLVVRPAADGPREQRIGAGVGAGVLVWRRARLEAALLLDGEVPAGDGATAAPQSAWARAMAVISIQRPGGLLVRLHVGASVIAEDLRAPPSLHGGVLVGWAVGAAAANPWPEPWGAVHDTDDARATCRAWAGSLVPADSPGLCGPLLAQSGGCSSGPVGWRSRMVWPNTGVPLLGAEEIDALVFNLESALWQASPCFVERHQAALLRLREHVARLREYLEGAAEHPEDAPALLRSASVGVDVGFFALGLLVLRSTGGYHQRSIDVTLGQCWDAIAEVDADPFWVDDKTDRVTDLHRTIEGQWESLIRAQARTEAGRRGVEAAGIVSGAMSLASAVGTLSRAWLVRQSGLGRLAAAIARALPGSEEGGGMVAALAGPTGVRVQMAVVPAGSRAVAATVELTAEEVARLVALGKLPPVAAVMMRTAGPTPAQIARSRGLSGSNSVSGRPAPGFRSTQRWDTTANATILRENLKKAGVRFRPDEQAHHIVPGTHPEAEEARELLDRYGIDINSADNGVVLEKVPHYGNGLHTDAKIRLVTKELSKAAKIGGRQGILDELRKIAHAIQKGTF